LKIKEMISKTKIKQLKTIFTEEKNILLVYIFGSVLQDNQHEESDADVAVLFKIYPDFEELSALLNKLENIFKQKVDLGILNDASPVFRYQVLSKGEVIYMHDSGSRDYFIIKTINEYDDLNYYRNIQEKNLLKGRIYA
jgi:predicted nucleotidyltransferase